jgi:hypothetical protein
MLMKAFFRAALLALPFLAVPSLANAQNGPSNFNAGINCHFNYSNGGCGISAGPWYTYFPYNAYFQTPAPIGGWPYWPAASMAVPPNNLPNVHSAFTPTVRPVAYQAAPSYWYERK